MDIRKQIGLLVLAHRTELGWTQKKLAKKAGCDRTYISGLERGVRNPTVVVLRGIAAAMGMTVSELLEGL